MVLKKDVFLVKKNHLNNSNVLFFLPPFAENEYKEFIKNSNFKLL